MIYEISTLLANPGPLRNFLNSFVVFLSIPHDGILRKTKKPFKKCLSWPRLASKVTCIFLQNFGLTIVNPSEISKYHSGGLKNPEIVQKLSILDFPV